jgi:hypothetical protein
MDDRRFDALARSLAAPHTRRRAVAALLGGGLLALLGRGGPDRDAARAAPNGCKVAGKVCKTSDQCCRPLVCFAGTCVAPTTTPANTPTPNPTPPVDCRPNGNPCEFEDPAVCCSRACCVAVPPSPPLCC